MAPARASGARWPRCSRPRALAWSSLRATPDRTAEVASEIGAVAGLAWDSADVDAAADLVARVTEDVGPVDILVTNTGGPPADPDPLSFSAEQWEQAHRTLVLAPMTLLKLVLPGMRDRGWGRIVAIASTTVREPISAIILSNAGALGPTGRLQDARRGRWPATG